MDFPALLINIEYLCFIHKVRSFLSTMVNMKYFNVNIKNSPQTEEILGDSLFHSGLVELNKAAFLFFLSIMVDYESL